MTADLDPHIDTIRKALIEQRGDIFAAIGYQTTVTASDEMVVELAAIEAALAALDTPPTPQPMPSAIPDEVRAALEIAKRSNMTALAFLRREGMRVPTMSAEMARDIDTLMAEERSIQVALAWLDEAATPARRARPPS